MSNTKSRHATLDTNVFLGKNADNVIEELQSQGYTPKRYKVNRLTEARPLSPITDEKVIQVYVNYDNTVQQIVTKH